VQVGTGRKIKHHDLDPLANLLICPHSPDLASVVNLDLDPAHPRRRLPHHRPDRDQLVIEKTGLIRVRAGISFALADAIDDGHCGLPHEELLALTRKLIEVPAELVDAALHLELQDSTVIADDLEGRRWVFLAGL
jgi:hypothetical protein